jgi:hypothetical protein
MATNERSKAIRRTTAGEGDNRMNPQGQGAAGGRAARRAAIAAGVCFLITHVTSVAAPMLYEPILHDARYITGAGPDTAALFGAFLEVILALANIGTAVALFPVVKRWNEGIALGYAGLRTLEAGIIAVGVLPLLAVVTLRQQFAGAAGPDAASLDTLGAALVAFHNATLLVGPGLVCGTNTVLMAYLMYRSGLVPRFIPVLGLVGGPLVFAYNAAVMLGFSALIPWWTPILVIPIFAWEVSLALWMIIKGFNSSAIAARPAMAETREVWSAA